MEVISLWHCWGVMEAQVYLTVAFSSSAFFGLLFLIFLLTILHRFSMGFRSGEFAEQSSTPTPWSFNQLLVILAVWTGATSCWKMKSASLKKLVSRRKHEAFVYFIIKVFTCSPVPASFFLCSSTTASGSHWRSPLLPAARSPQHRDPPQQRGLSDSVSLLPPGFRHQCNEVLRSGRRRREPANM